jgi:hypothetical protein
VFPHQSSTAETLVSSSVAIALSAVVVPAGLSSAAQINGATASNSKPRRRIHKFYKTPQPLPCIARMDTILKYAIIVIIYKRTTEKQNTL